MRHNPAYLVPPDGEPETPSGREVFSVSRLTSEARRLLERTFPLLWVEGEISNLRRISSGHWYFSLKDPSAQVRCAMFRGNNRLLRFSPRDGMQVLVRGRVSLYEPRGDFQLIVEHMEEAGDGALLRAFEALKQRLAAEGLFAPEHKRPVPALPRCIGVVTSPSGAAIRDVLSVLKRRFPAIPVLIYPAPVQGEEAPARIAAALRQAAQQGACDVILLTRGGGSLEDLWAFNDEALARAIHACPVPVVSAVGHEIDYTIADFVADRRAPTPSAAAELLSPDRREWRQRLDRNEQRLESAMRSLLGAKAQRLAWLRGRLLQQHPDRRLQRHAQRLDELRQRLLRAMDTQIRGSSMALGQLTARLHRHTPSHRLQRLHGRLDHLSSRLQTAMERRLEGVRLRLVGSSRALHAVSPLATLERGYAIITRLPDGEVVRHVKQVTPGDSIRARLSRGYLDCRVDAVNDDG